VVRSTTNGKIQGADTDPPRLLFQEQPKPFIPAWQFCTLKKVIQTIGFAKGKDSNRPLEYTPGPQPYLFMKEIISYFVFWGTWGLFQGSVSIFLEKVFQHLPSHKIGLVEW